MQTNKSRNTESSQFLKDAAFKKFWKENQYVEPSDQVINAWEAGLKQIEVKKKEVIEEFFANQEENQRQEALSFVMKATSSIMELYEEVKKDVPNVKLHLKLESHSSFEFLFSINNQNYFISNLELLYKKASKIDSISESGKNIAVRFIYCSEEFDDRQLSDDGFVFTFLGS